MSASFQVIPTPLALPGNCRACGSSSRESYLDTGLQFDFEGAVYYCNECVAYIASLFGFVTPEIANDLKERLERVSRELEDEKLKNMALNQAINSLQVAGYVQRTDSNDSVTSGVDLPVVSVPESNQLALEVLREGESTESENSDGPSESSDESRMANLSTGEGAAPEFNWD